MDEPESFRHLIARHQEDVGAASAIALIFALCYAVFKRLDWRRALMAAGAGSLFAAVVWVVVAEYIHPAIFILLPVAVFCGMAAFPLMEAYVRQDDKMADGVVSGAGGLLGRLLKRFTGGAP